MPKNVANILVVDDMVANRDALCDLIKALGHKPIAAKEGFVALKKLKEQAIDLVLLEIMKQEIDGYEVLSHIKDDITLQNVVQLQGLYIIRDFGLERVLIIVL
jgi:two-component system response regulator VanR